MSERYEKERVTKIMDVHLNSIEELRTRINNLRYEYEVACREALKAAWENKELLNTTEYERVVKATVLRGMI